MNSEENGSFSLAAWVLSVVIIEHITAQDLETYVKIFCQLLVTSFTLYTLWKKSGKVDREN